jgi:hypothetical protein
VQQQQQPFRGAAKERPVTFEEEVCVRACVFFGLFRERERRMAVVFFFFLRLIGGEERQKCGWMQGKREGYD